MIKLSIDTYIGCTTHIRNKPTSNSSALTVVRMFRELMQAHNYSDKAIQRAVKQSAKDGR